MEPVYSIQLYSGDNYCGCWHEPTTAETVARLNAAGFGAFCPHDDPASDHYPCTAPSRAFFFADELPAKLIAAECSTECRCEIAEAVA